MSHGYINYFSGHVLRYVSFQRVYLLMLSSLLVFLWPRWENGRTERSHKKSSLRVTLSPNNGGSQALLVNLYCFNVTNMVPSGTQTWQWTFATSNFRLILNFNDFPVEIPKNKVRAPAGALYCLRFSKCISSHLIHKIVENA